MVTPNGTNGINGFGGFDDERETLLHTALFKQVSSEEARELLPYLQHAEYDKGDFIFREGDTDHRMYLLEEGRVKLTRQSSDKRVQLLSIHAYGEVLGEIPVFDPHGGPRTASAVAMTNGTRVVWLEHDALFDWLEGRPWPDEASRPLAETDGPGFRQLGWKVSTGRLADGLLVTVDPVSGDVYEGDINL